MPQDKMSTKAEMDDAYEKYKDYLSKPGDGASLLDDWNEMAPDFLDQCTIPYRGDWEDLEEDEGEDGDGKE